MSGFTGKPSSCSHCRALVVGPERDALRGDADLVGPERQRPPGGEPRVELAHGAGGRVARVHEGRLAGRCAALVERLEVRQRHVDLAAHLEQRRRIRDVQPQRDLRDRAQVVGDVLTDLAVAARHAAHEQPVLVDQRHRQAVDLRLGDELEGRVLDALAREEVAHALDPGAQLLGRARVGQRQHALQVADLDQVRDRLLADALGRRIGCDQLRIGLLESPSARCRARRTRRRRSPGHRARGSDASGSRSSLRSSVDALGGVGGTVGVAHGCSFDRLLQQTLAGRARSAPARRRGG